VDEIQHILTDVVFVNRGRAVLAASMEEVEGRYAELSAPLAHTEAARALKPMHERKVFDRNLFLFQDADRARLARLGEVRTPSLADLFMALMGSDQPGKAA
jgi:ABC-2 type transport system ATP-binding protein